LETLRRFLNTVPREGRPDLLGSPEALARWLASQGLVPTGSELSDRQHRRALGLRAALLGHVQRDPEAQRRLETVCRDLRFELAFDDRDIPRFQPVSNGSERALGALVEIFVRARHARAWRRLKPCRECGRVFYDSSHNRVGKWCSDRCGDRVRAAKARRRKKARRR